MSQVNVLSVASYLPGEPITNQQLEELVGPLTSELLESTNVKFRNWLTDPYTGEMSETNSEMSVKAIKKAIEKANLTLDDIGLLVMSTSSPDHPLPAAVTYVQEHLGIKKLSTLQICSGCSGVIQALDVAKMYLSAGMVKNAVVVGTEVISPLLYNVFKGKEKEELRLRDLLSIYSFGDGSAAMVLQGSQNAKGAIIGENAFAGLGGDKKAGMVVPLGGTAVPITSEAIKKRLFTLKVDFKGSQLNTPSVLSEGLKDTLKASGIASRKIDICVIPEGNTGYLREELERANYFDDDWENIEGKIHDNLQSVGNTGSPAVLLAFEDAVKRNKVSHGDYVMLLGIESSKWLYGGTVFEWQGN